MNNIYICKNNIHTDLLSIGEQYHCELDGEIVIINFYNYKYNTTDFYVMKIEAFNKFFGDIKDIRKEKILQLKSHEL